MSYSSGPFALIWRKETAKKPVKRSWGFIRIPSSHVFKEIKVKKNESEVGTLGEKKTQDEQVRGMSGPGFQGFNQCKRNARSCMRMMLGNSVLIFINVLCVVGNCEHWSLCLPVVFGKSCKGKSLHSTLIREDEMVFSEKWPLLMFLHWEPCRIQSHGP